jgi:hypothetical protein
MDFIYGIDNISRGDIISFGSMGGMALITHKQGEVLTCRKLSKYKLIRFFQYWFFIRFNAFKYNAKIIKEYDTPEKETL